MGPSKVFGIDEDLMIVCVGMVILGYSWPFIFSTALSEVMEEIQLQY